MIWVYFIEWNINWPRQMCKSDYMVGQTNWSMCGELILFWEGMMYGMDMCIWRKTFRCYLFSVINVWNRSVIGFTVCCSKNWWLASNYRIASFVSYRRRTVWHCMLKFHSIDISFRLRPKYTQTDKAQSVLCNQTHQVNLLVVFEEIRLQPK